MSVIELINYLTQHDIRVWMEHGQLRFSAPQGGMNETTRQLLKKHKTELIAFLHTSQSSHLQAIKPINQEQAQVLSFSQERIWFLSQLHPNNTALHLPIVFSIRGPLDINLLEHTFTHLIERHAILRTAFRQTLAGTVQQTQAAHPVTIPRESCAKPLQPADIQRMAEEHMQAPFDLENGDVCHIHLVSAPEDQHFLLITLHHIATDAWSMGILAKEMAHIYQALTNGKTPELSPLPFTYNDYAVWQKQQFTHERREHQLRFWRTALQECENLALPADYPRTQPIQHKGESLLFQLDAATTAQLRTLAREYKTTLYVTLISLLGILLFRYTQQNRFCIGTPTAGRPNSDCENMIGCFINVLPIPFQHNNTDSFSSLLHHNRTTLQSAMTHQDLPFEEIVKAVIKHRDAQTTPLFQILFGLQNAPVEAVNTLNNLHIELLHVQKTAATYELNIMAKEWQDHLQFEIEYRSDLFKNSSIASLRDNFLTLIQSAINNPELRIDKLAIVNQHDQHLQLLEWVNTHQNWPAFTPPHYVIEQQAKHFPDRIALRYQDSAISYAEMNARANRLAHVLKSAGTAPADIVAVLLERSEQLPITLLAIQKAGACYLPLDPEHPTHRLSRILADAKPKICISHTALQETLDHLDIPVLYIDKPVSEDPENNGNLDITFTQEQVFNIIYTSGSTGLPKGVIISHGAISNRLRWMQATFPINQNDKILHKTPYHFDVSVWEIFWPLMQGAELIIAEPGEHKNPNTLITLIEQHNISVMHFVPSMLAVFLQALPAGGCSSLKRIFSSGETLPPALVNACYRQLPKIQLENLYGPTEAAIDVSWHHCLADEKQTPIGKAISNTQLYILDAALQLMPIGAQGEIHIGGAGLAQGYLHNPDLTHQVFISNPFNPGSRLYKTGDIGCFDHDGNLYFKGRRDQQIKIRGLRVELGEIENLVNLFPSIQSTLITARTDNANANIIIAYFIATEHIDIQKLRLYLQTLLPGYMIPNAFVQIQQWPMLSNGKINLKGLPDPERKDLLDEAFTAPRNATEIRIAEVWKELLQLDNIGIHDNFFELGGHSLLATIALTRLQNEFKVKIPLSAFFNEPTIANFAQAIDNAKPAQSDNIEEITL